MSDWFMPREIGFAEGHLFCFPYAGGGAGAFKAFEGKLPNMVGMQYPGRESRIAEKAIDNMDELADAIVKEIAPYTERPYAFLGHSLGSRVSYEVAWRLVQAGYPAPSRLIVCGSRAPDRPELRPLHAMDDDEFIAGLSRFDGTPRELLEHPEVLRFFVPMLRADFSISELWTAPERPPLPVPVTAFCGSADEEAPPCSMRRWRRFTSCSFSLQMLPGT
ncbi:MAG: thioesterase, partial [Desulfovibrio sp.]|nr:thioesterase [Desulfovibrio sp.]